MKSTVYVHKKTGKFQTIIPIMEIGNYREATKEEIEFDQLFLEFIESIEIFKSSLTK